MEPSPPIERKTDCTIPGCHDPVEAIVGILVVPAYTLGVPTSVSCSVNELVLVEHPTLTDSQNHSKRTVEADLFGQFLLSERLP